ncbi:hypothetical protein BJ508DRAFT_336554 [Ascobolus immersus RN42]|uniref:Uncharacterized protein n=1 Tax=Ascobolus immersus RN42 TaxID=1160509 RepID=A0A3N4HD13_ASCIM|nr:hypothetical protein BJ508DRAFT_336554 [Ascobolus immersus RN42]
MPPSSTTATVPEALSIPSKPPAITATAEPRPDPMTRPPNPQDPAPMMGPIRDRNGRGASQTTCTQLPTNPRKTGPTSSEFRALTARVDELSGLPKLYKEDYDEGTSKMQKIRDTVVAEVAGLMAMVQQFKESISTDMTTRSLDSRVINCRVE